MRSEAWKKAYARLKRACSLYEIKPRDPHGVRVMNGPGDVPSILECLYYVGMAIVFSLLVYRGITHPGLFTSRFPTWCRISGLLFPISLWWLAASVVRLRLSARRLLDVEKPRQRYQLSDDYLLRLANQRGAEPRYNLNGRDFYDVRDFGDAVSLLRSSQAPAAQPETLLRPAARAETPQDNLLRAGIRNEPPA